MKWMLVLYFIWHITPTGIIHWCWWNGMFKRMWRRVYFNLQIGTMATRATIRSHVPSNCNSFCSLFFFLSDTFTSNIHTHTHTHRHTNKTSEPICPFGAFWLDSPVGNIQFSYLCALGTYCSRSEFPFLCQCPSFNAYLLASCLPVPPLPIELFDRLCPK